MAVLWITSPSVLAARQIAEDDATVKHKRVLKIKSRTKASQLVDLFHYVLFNPHFLSSFSRAVLLNLTPACSDRLLLFLSFLHLPAIFSNEFKQLSNLNHHDPDQKKAFPEDELRKAVNVWCSATKAVFMLTYQ